jgi:tRNA threonylcarbamoyl adenosine modification protein YeaZ
MHTLVFDTTAGGTVIGLFQDNKRIAKIEKLMEFGQAEELAMDVDKMLKDHHLCFADVDLLGVCTGPGSFTGVSAGLAFARGLALGAPELKITGVSAFEVYAKMLKPENRATYNAVVIETKREDFYFQMFDEYLNKLTEPLALTREEIAKKLKNHQTSFIGDGVERLLSVPLGLQIKQVELSEIISVEALFEVAYQKYFEKTLDFPKPLYIRGAETCVK